jgi:hypothetical protein
LCFFLHLKMCTSSHAPCRNSQITVRMTGQYSPVRPLYGTCVMSSFRCLEFGGGFQIFGKCGPGTDYMTRRKFTTKCLVTITVSD